MFTVNGGNTRAKSSVVPVHPNRPIVYDDDEPDRLFYTNQSRQLFVLCRKVYMHPCSGCFDTIDTKFVVHWLLVYLLCGTATYCLLSYFRVYRLLFKYSFGVSNL